MGGFICKQPNGLYCRYSSVVDSITHWNMTEEDYIEYCAERAREEARHTLKHRLKPFEHILEDFYPYNMSVEKFKEVVREMGYEGELPDDKYYEEPVGAY